MEETSISSNAVISSSAGRRERLGEVDCFELSSSSVLKLQKGDITTWFVDGRTDAIVIGRPMLYVTKSSMMILSNIICHWSYFNLFTYIIRDTTGLTAENAELRLRLQTIEQHAQLRDALNEALKHEVGRLEIATGETSSTGEANEVGLRLRLGRFFICFLKWSFCIKILTFVLKLHFKKQRKNRPKRNGTKSLALQSLILPNPAATYKLPLLSISPNSLQQITHCSLTPIPLLIQFLTTILEDFSD